MKNIHVLPTDKPSRLYLTTEKYIFEEVNSLSTDECQNKHIYITSDEEIKEGDWVIQVNFEKTNTQLIQCVDVFQVKIANDKDGSFTKNKIIITTDQDLIKDGVQAIDDEFLEWFVKNPSCERVEVTEYFDSGFSYGYKIIAPKEEPKQDETEYLLSIKTNKNRLLEDVKQEQDKKMYSEEEVLDILFTMSVDNPNNITKWFEQFKNK